MSQQFQSSKKFSSTEFMMQSVPTLASNTDAMAGFSMTTSPNKTGSRSWIRFVFFLFFCTASIQFLGCGSAEISSAKLYRQQRNYPKAEQLLLQALKSNPSDDEAWTLYVQNLYDLRKYEKIAEVIDTARLYAITHRADVDNVRQNTWAQLYNGGLDAYNQNPDSKEQQKAAIGFLEAAKKLAPEQPETYEVLGQVYFASGDTAKSIETYNNAIRQMSSSHEQGVALGIMLKMSAPNVVQAIGGDPARKLTVPLTSSDSAMVYVYPSKEAYIYFERQAKAPHAYQLMGWRFTSNEQMGLQPLRVSTLPYQTVANFYYQKGLAAFEAKDKEGMTQNLEKAIPMLLMIQRLDPADEFASAAIPDIYLKLERTEKAKQQYEKLLQDHPSKSLYVAYGTLLLKANDYEGAIANYDKALAIDPAYESALYNTAAAYKNWAAAEQKANPATGKKNPKADLIKQRMEKSTDYFERLHAVNKNDFNTLANLIDNYEVLDKKDKSAKAFIDMEALKSTEAANDPLYWEFLGKTYARLNKADEAAAAYKKADQLKH
jgi:tetratricopeptide (TPR) repeat protein